MRRSFGSMWISLAEVRQGKDLRRTGAGTHIAKVVAIVAADGPLRRIGKSLRFLVSGSTPANRGM